MTAKLLDPLGADNQTESPLPKLTPELTRKLVKGVANKTRADA